MISVLKRTWLVLCLRFADILAKNFVFIFLQFLIFCFRVFLPKNAAMHPHMLFFGGDTKLRKAFNALLKLRTFTQLHNSIFPLISSCFSPRLSHYQVGIFPLTYKRPDLIFLNKFLSRPPSETQGAQVATLESLLDIKHSFGGTQETVSTAQLELTTWFR